MASRPQLALRDAIAGALVAAANSNVSDDTYEYRYSEIFPRLVRDADAGTLPDDPEDWLRQQLESELRSTSPQAAAKREVLEQAAELVAAAHLGPADIATMLARAGAPEPADSAVIIQLAGRCLTVAMGHQSSTALDAKWEPYKPILLEAGEALRKLRQLMPSLIEICKRSGDELRAFYCERFEREIATVEFPRHKFSIGVGRAVWEPGARELADVYREIVNRKAGWSRNGPAVRFLMEALRRAYPGTYPTAAAIEMLLARRGPASPIRGTQMTLDKMRR
jgi:hypothetical protein